MNSEWVRYNMAGTMKQAKQVYGWGWGTIMALALGLVLLAGGTQTVFAQDAADSSAESPDDFFDDFGVDEVPGLVEDVGPEDAADAQDEEDPFAAPAPSAAPAPQDEGFGEEEGNAPFVPVYTPPGYGQTASDMVDPGNTETTTLATDSTDAVSAPVVEDVVLPPSERRLRALANRDAYADRFTTSIVYFPMLDMYGVPVNVEQQLIRTIRAAVENPKVVGSSTAIRGLILDDFIQVLYNAVGEDGDIDEWRAGRYDLKYQDYIIPAADIKTILSADYLYQPKASLKVIARERKREFRDEDGKRHRYFLKFYDVVVSLDISLWRMNWEMDTLEKIAIRPVSYMVRESQEVGRDAEGEFFVRYSEDEVRRKALLRASRDVALTQNIRRALGKVRMLRLNADLVESNGVWGKINVTDADGARPDSWFSLHVPEPDGNLKFTGWARMYDVGRAEEGATESTVLMAGSPIMMNEGGDAAIEYPLLGISVMPKVTMLNASWTGINDPDGFGTIPGFGSQIAAGLEVWGMLSQIIRLPITDWWLGTDFLIVPGDLVKQAYWGMAVGKRYWLGRLGVMPHLGFLKHIMSMEAIEHPQTVAASTKTNYCELDNNGSMDCLHKATQTGFRAGVRWELMVHPRFSLAGNVNYVTGKPYQQFIRTTTNLQNLAVKRPYSLRGNQFTPGGLMLNFGALVTF